MVRNRGLKNKGIEELLEMANDLKFIEGKVKTFSLLPRRYFRKRLRMYEKNLGKDYLNLIYEYVHQVYNCAYEDTLWFRKHGKLRDYRK